MWILKTKWEQQLLYWIFYISMCSWLAYLLRNIELTSSCLMVGFFELAAIRRGRRKHVTRVDNCWLYSSSHSTILLGQKSFSVRHTDQNLPKLMGKYVMKKVKKKKNQQTCHNYTCSCYFYPTWWTYEMFFLSKTKMIINIIHTYVTNMKTAIMWIC